MQSFERVFVDIDTQFDFLDPVGKLYVTGAMAIYPALERIAQYARHTGTPVLSSADDHSAHDPEFEQLPRHCEEGTLGQHKMTFTLLPHHMIINPASTLPAGPLPLLREYNQLIFHKNHLDAFTNPHFARIVDELRTNQYVVFGVATEGAVKCVVEGLLARGKPVAVVSDGTHASDVNAGLDLCRNWAGRGVHFVRAAEITREDTMGLPDGEEVNEE